MRLDRDVACPMLRLLRSPSARRLLSSRKRSLLHGQRSFQTHSCRIVKKPGCEPDDVELSPIQAAHTRLRRGMYMYRREDAVVLVKEAFRDRSSDDADGCFLRSHSSHFPSSHALISSSPRATLDLHPSAEPRIDQRHSLFANPVFC